MTKDDWTERADLKQTVYRFDLVFLPVSGINSLDFASKKTICDIIDLSTAIFGRTSGTKSTKLTELVHDVTIEDVVSVIHNDSGHQLFVAISLESIAEHFFIFSKSRF